MLIKLARFFRYDDSGWNCKTSRLADPTWDDIENGVRQLNKVQFPFVWLFLAADAADDEVPDFEVMGGDGDYVMAVTDPNGVHRRFRFPSHSNKWLHVWTSDQGCEMEEKFVCHDVDFVLRVLRRYADTGELEPSAVLE
ncbi:MAG TPA: hypothetical protein VM008_04350 [Phycisphaerae bacterium]|nr:hypothetical protein [Phycisphaerae bacterium]